MLTTRRIDPRSPTILRFSDFPFSNRSIRTTIPIDYGVDWWFQFEIAVQDSGFRIQDSGFRIQDSGFRIQDQDSRIPGFEDSRIHD
jgi:hypothetical protein